MVIKFYAVIVSLFVSAIIEGSQELRIDDPGLGTIPEKALVPIVEHLETKRDRIAFALASKKIYTAPVLQPLLQNFPLSRYWRTQQIVCTLLQGQHSECIKSIAFSSDGYKLISGSRDGTIKIRNLATNKEIQTFSGHTGAIHAVAISPTDSNTVASGSDDATARLWDAQSGKMKCSLYDENLYQDNMCTVKAVAFSPDGTMLAIGIKKDHTHPAILKLLDIAKNESTYIKLELCARIYVEFASNDKLLVSIWDSLGSSFFSYEIELKERKIDRAWRKERTFYNIESDDVVCAQSLTKLFILIEKNVYHKKVCETYNMWGRKKVVRYKCGAKISSLAEAPDGSMLATGSNDHKIKLWSADTKKNEDKKREGKLIKEFLLPRTAKALCFSRDGTRLAAGLRDGTVWLLQKESEKFC